MTDNFKAYENKINQSESILIVYGEKASVEAVAAATSFFLWLKNLEKKVVLASPVLPVVEFCNLVGINKVKTHLPQENLVISLPYDETKIDKVLSDLNSQRQELSLIIKPQKGQPPLKIEDLKISYQSPEFGLIILIDVRDEKELLKLEKNSSFWQNPDKIISLNSFDSHCPVAASISEILSNNIGFCSFFGNFLRLNQVETSADQASNILLGLDKETSNFTNQDCSADNFELAAWLLRQGGARYRADETVAVNFKAKNHLPQMSNSVIK